MYYKGLFLQKRRVIQGSFCKRAVLYRVLSAKETTAYYTFKTKRVEMKQLEQEREQAREGAGENKKTWAREEASAKASH